MITKIILFFKKNYVPIIAVSFLIIGAILMLYATVNLVPLQNLERDYQIDTFGYYDSSIKYLKDVDNSLSYFTVYFGIGIAILFSDLLISVFCCLDMYNTKKKNLKG